MTEQRTEPEEEIFKERETRTALFRFAMKKLSPRCRFVLELRDRDELPFGQIAVRMGIDEVSARTLYFKAKRRIKHIIESIVAGRRFVQGRRRRT
jgi:RNA polymerase sigma factor (sigma-70 family)